jgi:UDP-glucose 4-epimerase
LFSSSATVYGADANLVETKPFLPMNPYGETKVCVEMLIKSIGNLK